MQKLLDLWYSIPRDKEWWIDRISALLSGCSTGCFTIFALYVVTVVVAVVVALVVAPDARQALGLGFAWGSAVAIVTTSLGGSALLALIAWWRGT